MLTPSDAYQPIESNLGAPLAANPVAHVESPYRIWPSAVVIPACFVAFILTSILGVLIAVVWWMGANGRQPSEAEVNQIVMNDIRAILLSSTFPQVSIATIVVIAAAFSSLGIRRRLRLIGNDRWPTWLGIAAALATPIVGLMTAVFASLILTESDHLKMMSDMIRQHGQNGMLIPILFCIAVVPAVCEELVFRGYLQPRLIRSMGRWMSVRGSRPKVAATVSAILGIGLSSLLFATFHLDPTHIVVVIPLGIWLGIITHKTGSLYPAMLGHFVNNAVSVIGTVYGSEGFNDVSLDWTNWSTLILGGTGMLLTIVGCVIYRGSPPSADLAPNATGIEPPSTPDPATAPASLA
jgi:uncharacterized protein